MKAELSYTKMHGAGNSFILTESLHGELRGADLHGLALRLCCPETGPGADGMIVVLPPEGGADFRMLFFNSDGSLGEMCGNGARCVARYGAEHGLAGNTENIRILTDAGLVFGRRITQELYEVRLNDPSVIDLNRSAATENGPVSCSYIELGSPGLPHAVVDVPAGAFDDPDALRERGRALRRSPSFPKGANVTFACVTGQRSVRAVTFERGVEDFTLACGTGCGATAVSLILRGLVSGDTVDITMPGGQLRVTLHADGNSARDLLLTGPTCVVEIGRFSL